MAAVVPELREEIPLWMQAFLKFLAKIIRPPQWLFPATIEWRWHPIIYKDFIVPAKGKRLLYDEIASGWLHFVLCDCDNSDLVFCCDVYGEGIVEIRVSAKDIYEYGLIRPSDKTIWLARYDDAAKKYVLLFTPSGLGIPFRGRNRAWFENPTDTDIKVRYFTTWLIILVRP